MTGLLKKMPISDLPYLPLQSKWNTMSIRIFILLIVMAAFSASCQNEPAGKSKDDATTSIVQNKEKSIDLSNLRRTLEDKVEFPADQNIRVDRLEPTPKENLPQLIYEGYIDGAFQFKQLDHEGNELTEYLPFNFHWDNFEGIAFQESRIPFDLPENDHLMCAYFINEDGTRMPGESTLQAQMIRIQNGDIIKSEDAMMLLYYNLPRGSYDANDPYVLLDFVITKEAEGGLTGIQATVDGRDFTLPRSGTYMIKGLKPGNHMVEIKIFRMDEMYNAPLNPSRMTFVTE